MIALMTYKPRITRVELERRLLPYNLSLRKFAARVGVNHQTLLNWLNGVNAPQKQPEMQWQRIEDELRLVEAEAMVIRETRTRPQFHKKTVSLLITQLAGDGLSAEIKAQLKDALFEQLELDEENS